ncbi:MAG: tetratricopeptide repeat protein [Proteobacteria bacterium]|nr:tetratricopeptide repeat protein [Pseudomonadota bacterium]
MSQNHQVDAVTGDDRGGVELSRSDVEGADGGATETDEAKADEEKEPGVPNLALDNDSLYNILMSDIALHYGHIETSLESAVAVAKVSKDQRLVRKAAALALQLNKFEQSAEMARLWSELMPQSQEPIQVLVIALTAAGDQKQALAAAVSLIEQQDNIETGVRTVAGLMNRQRNPEAAVRLLQDIADLWPDLPQAYMSLSYVARAYGQQQLSRDALEKALEIEPDWDEAAVTKVDYLVSDDQTAEATAFVAQYLDENPNSQSMLVRSSRLLAVEEQYEAAWDRLKSTLRSKEVGAPTLYFAAILATEVGQERRVTGYLERAIEKNPGFDRARMYLAARYADEQDFEAAFDQYQQVRDPSLSEDAMIQMVLVTEEIRGTDEALSFLERMDIQSQGQYLKYVLTRHELLVRDRRMDEAYSFLNDALQNVPGNQALLYARGLVAAELKLVDVMEADFKSLIEIEPENASALNALGYTLADQTDRLQEARGYIGRALELRPKDPYIMDSMGWVEYRLGELDLARTLLTEAYQVNGDVEIAAHLGEVLWELGEAEKARDVWLEAIGIDSDNPILLETLERYPSGAE